MVTLIFSQFKMYFDDSKINCVCTLIPKDRDTAL